MACVFFLSFSFLVYPFCCSALIALHQAPCAVAYTPNSVLRGNLSKTDIRYAGNRPRYSTCTGVSWFQGSKYLAAVGLQSGTVQTYTFDGFRLTPFVCFDNRQGILVDRPEGVAFSFDERYAAIPNMKSGKVNIYETNVKTVLNPKPISSWQDDRVHGAAFSQDGTLLAIASWSSVKTFAIKGGLFSALVQTIPCAYVGLRPKNLDFSPDGRFLAVSYSTAQSSEKKVTRACIAAYRFDPATHFIDPKPVGELFGLVSAESLIFSPDGATLLAVDQVQDRVTAHHFDTKTGRIEGTYIALKNPEAQLSFPHGMSISRDGKFLAVSNYGDDKVTVYDILPNTLLEGR